MTENTGGYVTTAAAMSYIERVQAGWHVRRNGCGFLCWSRNNEWESMAEDEAAVWHLLACRHAERVATFSARGSDV